MMRGQFAHMVCSCLLAIFDAAIFGIELASHRRATVSAIMVAIGWAAAMLLFAISLIQIRQSSHPDLNTAKET